MKNNTKAKNTAEILVVVYAVMLAICVWITKGSDMDKVSISINAVMFIIVGVIFLLARKNLKIVQLMTAQLNSATAQIESDYKLKYEAQKDYLWEEYKKKKGEELFKEKSLSEAYQAYLDEMERLENRSHGNYKCEIDHYVNKELIDITVKKNLLNLIPGTMTGLGILGTFVGLSLGLQSFNTGTAAEIADSIAPLMAGIKVAFHTSVYGMVFSLFFNYVYKTVLENAYNALDNFLDKYDLRVTGNAEGDNASNMQCILRELPYFIGQRMGEQISKYFFPVFEKFNATIETNTVEMKDAFRELSAVISNTMGEKIDAVMSPAFGEMNVTLEKFADRVSENQLESISKIVDSFLCEMNKSLGDSFTNLGKIVNETCELQKQNNYSIQNILNDVERMVTDIREINELSDRTIRGFANYINRIESLQEIINDNFTSVNIQMEEQQRIQSEMKDYIEVLVEYEKRISKVSDTFEVSMAAHIESYNKTEQQVSDTVKERIALLAQNAQEYNQSLADTAKNHIREILELSSGMTYDIEKAAKELSNASEKLNGQIVSSLNTSFEQFDKNLVDVTDRLNGAMAEVAATTERVPQVMATAYDGMEKTVNQLQTKFESLIHELEIIQRNFVETDNSQIKE